MISFSQFVARILIRDLRKQRKFNQSIAKKVLLTDITYLPGAKGFIGYLSTIKDGATNEISAYYVSDNRKLDMLLKIIDRLVSAYGTQLRDDAYIHLGQGVQSEIL